ncbi:hypothetical protein CBR_g23796 [Chara braunii]|uniref:Uncharacterized protein n=1 Tax=Chara braunii TaxID=69332 RepID=A0A388JVN7_CHABU|nr:hypothetical protein CBR_g23796 [Chara braunii]|eukprot:GBG61840.1 hypothetical protein CBR_g23796 [Chara braunii]
MARHTLFTRLWRKYVRALRRRPLRTKMLTSGTLMGVSDAMAQKISGTDSIKLWRTALMALYGLLWVGPTGHYWHEVCESFFSKRRDNATVIRKVAVEQLTYGPVQNVSMMIYLGLIIKGKAWNTVVSKIRADLLRVQVAAWKIWPLAALINHKFVPIQLRVLFMNLVALFWSSPLTLNH